MTGLRALEKLCNQCEFYRFEKGSKPKKCPFNKKCVYKERIEKELKELEEYRDADIKVCAGSLLTCTKDFETLWNELKALEIIFNKEVNIDILEQCKDVETYNKCVHYLDRQLEKQEFDLVKLVKETFL